MKTLNVSLPDPLEAFVQGKLKTGGYSSASEVVREALRLLQQQDAERLRVLRATIQEGLDSPMGHMLDEISSADVAARGMKRLAKTRRQRAR